MNLFNIITVLFGIFIIHAIIRIEKSISALEDLLGGIGVSGVFREKHGDVFNHAIELDEKVKRLAQRIDILERRVEKE